MVSTPAKLILIIANEFINRAKNELATRNADYEQQKRSEELRKGSIDVEFKVKG